MAIIVEDGSLVPNANSYIDLDFLRAYATARGITSIPTDDDAAEVLINKAMDYIEIRRNRYQGYKVDTDQALQFPRYNLFLDGFRFPDNEIPQTLMKAEAQLCCEAVTSDLMPNVDSRFITRKEIGPLVTEWSDKFGPNKGASFTRVEQFLLPLFARGSMRLINYKG